jgi:cell division initiation protein
MKNGYDRFAVDDAVERYAAQVDALQKKLALYEEQMDETNSQLNDLKAKYQEVIAGMDAKQQAADEIARLSLREANQIIDTAQKNADSIVREALSTARLILTDLSRLYNDAGSVKGSMQKQLEDLIQDLDKFQMPKMPDMRWLSEAEQKMR